MTSRGRVLARSAVVGVCLLVAGACPATARAQGSPSIESGLTVGQGSQFVPGTIETFVRIRNPTKTAIAGTVRVSSREMDDMIGVGTAEFSAAAGGTSIVRVPIHARQAVRVEVLGPNGGVLSQVDLNATPETSVRIFDVAEPSRLRPILENVQMSTAYLPPINPGIGGSSAPTGGPRLRVYSARVDVDTGEPLLPTQGAAWHGMHAVFMPSHTLVALGDEEREALATYVAGGGTLAISVDRPDDLRHPALVALVGGEASLAQPPDACFAEVRPPFAPNAALVALETAGLRPGEGTPFTSYAGGNLRPSVFGASATYGIGEVELLGFDPQNPQVASDPWVELRMLELARRGFERSFMSVSRVGDGAPNRYSPRMDDSTYESVRRVLDPNRSARWGVVIASLLISIYAIVAGPVLFARAKKQNRPLWALRVLPVLSAITFLLVVVLGVVSKGVRPLSNRLTVVDLGAGMSEGAGRRYRAFFASGAQTVDATQESRTSMITPAMDPRSPFMLSVDRDAVKLVGLESEPAQTVVLRDDGLVRLPGSVDIREDDHGAIVVENHFDQALQALVVRLPDGTFRFEKSLAPGASVSSDAMGRGKSRFATWGSNFGSIVTSPAAPKRPPPASGAIRSLNPSMFRDALRAEGEADTGEAWAAIEDTVGQSSDWFPAGVPSLLAEVQGGTQRKVDSGVRVDSDRLLIRVVGFGRSR